MGYNGPVLGGTGGGGGGGSTAFESFLETAGVGDGPTIGATTWTFPGLVGATKFNYFLLNNQSLTRNVDFSFNPATGTITRPFVWAINDVVTGTYRAAA